RGRRRGRLRGGGRRGGRGEIVTQEERVNDEPRIDAPAEPEQLTEEAPAEEAPLEPDPIAEVARERDEYLDSLQRLKAEFDNYRKRTAREQIELTTRAGERLVKELLPVLDDLERALEAAEQHEEAKLEDGV